ncbi:SDR family NAD(P)-dependent oxidoreductase [Kribbella turkmenica]|uniref:SDR family NAD(P)-dependent oxidoreductase n=1 Tax=Kribbella turkmenica TaxID=2530375 RepID=UPI0038990C40
MVSRRFRSTAPCRRRPTEVTAIGGRGIAIACDHRDDEQTKQAAAQVAADTGRLDVLVNNVWAATSSSGTARNSGCRRQALPAHPALTTDEHPHDGFWSSWPRASPRSGNGPIAGTCNEFDGSFDR